MSSRDAILKTLRSALPVSAALPDLPATGPWQTFDDAEARFAEVLETVGGTFCRVASVQQADEQLRQLDAWKAASVRCSVVHGLGDSTFDLDSIDDPHALENIDYAVLRGHFGVAENAAIWVTDDAVRHRVLYFIPQHLSIVIPSGQIVHNMHEAYARIKVGQHAFAGFISGPSKTADIEQSLVIGAHGARSLMVFAVDELNDV
jgi:L-lactate dehydrogenase complex protein LldG